MTRPIDRLTTLTLASLACAALACASPSPSLCSADPYTLEGSANFLSGYPAINPDGTVNVVVEIPTGTNAKWEVDKEDGRIRWEFKKGRPRVVKYLAYPGNYGMVPRTLLPKALGGDGDPLDVLVLGPALGRGTVARVRIVGVLQLLDDGEQDDKLIGVRRGTAFDDVRDLDELDAQFHGVTEIIETWFANYKGPGEMEVLGYRNADSGQATLRAAAQAYEKTQRAAAASR